MDGYDGNGVGSGGGGGGGGRRGPGWIITIANFPTGSGVGVT